MPATMPTTLPAADAPALSPVIQSLREIALARKEWPDVPGVPLVDARTWQTRAPGEDWLVWRARRTAERLHAMPVEVSPGEQIVGRPAARRATGDEIAAMQAVGPVLEAIPPYPGGDSGHFQPDYEKLFRVGIGGLRAEVRARAQGTTPGQAPFYQACAIALEGLAAYVDRTAAACDAAARSDAADAPRWRELAALVRRVADAPPATFHEAIELMFLTLVAGWFAEDHGLSTPGRMDRTLRPFYEADLAAGRITRQEALDLIGGLYIQLNMICHPGAAISVIVGGRYPDGSDITNELTYLCLEARQATRLVYPTVGIAWHPGSPPELMRAACRMLATGIGCPAFFNDELIADGLRAHGVADADAVDYMNSTCVEIKPVGASNIWVTAPYFNCPRAALEEIAAAAGDVAAQPATYAEFAERVRANLAEQVRRAAADLDATWRRRAVEGCFPLASCLIRDCLERGLDFDRGGARYNWVENSFVGLANLADSMLVVKHLVYERRELTLADLHAILQADFQGHEALRQRILQTVPHYGCDNDEADTETSEWAAFLTRTTEANTVGPHRYVPGFFCWIMHGHFGESTGATPDGRRAHTALADGAGASQGRETSGPTASALSTTRWSHLPALGGLVHNVKLSRGSVAAPAGQAAMAALIRTYLQRGGFEIQVNVVDAGTLRDAQARPEAYPDLLVRVAGYSDYFTHLSRTLQEEVIAREEHGFGE